MKSYSNDHSTDDLKKLQEIVTQLQKRLEDLERLVANDYFSRRNYGK